MRNASVDRSAVAERHALPDELALRYGRPMSSISDRFFREVGRSVPDRR
jgi:hypothetical protein